MRAGAVTLAVLLLLAGCRTGSSGTTASRVRLLDTVPGFRRVHLAAETLSADALSRATTAPAPAIKGYLAGAGFQGARERVWSLDPADPGSEFVSIIGAQFFAPHDASGLVDLVVSAMASSKAYEPFSVPVIPGARGWQLTSAVDGRVRFCDGVWWQAGSEAYSVTRCAPHPLSVDAVVDVATRQSAVVGS